MAEKNYGANNINWGSFDEWSQAYSSDSNISIATAKGNMHPAQSAPWAASTLRSKNIFYGRLIAGTGGNVEVTNPYSSGTGADITIKQVFIDSHNVVIQANATYPYTFNSWRPAAGGGGSVVSSANPLTISQGDYTGTSVIYAYFTTTHSDPG